MLRTFHKGEFRALTERHIQYELPDMQHMVDIHVWSNSVSLSVYRISDYFTRESMQIHFEKCPKWKDIVWGFEELAAKKYAAPVRHKNVTPSQIRRGW